jgi:hypothetical protein
MRISENEGWCGDLAEPCVDEGDFRRCACRYGPGRDAALLPLRFPPDVAADAKEPRMTDTPPADRPRPEVIAQEIVDDLEAALEQFRLIAWDLNCRTAGSAV